jgi:hypothetical protein
MARVAASMSALTSRFMPRKALKCSVKSALAVVRRIGM